MDIPEAVSAGKEAVWRTLAEADARLGVAAPTSQNVVLMYHSVGGSAGNTDGRVVTVEAFRELLAWLDGRYEFVDLPAVLDAGDGPRVAVTFDDAYRSVHRHALPVLREFDAPATVYVIADRVGGATERGVPYLTEAQIRELVADDLVTVGNHTRTHARLSALDEAALREEVVGAKDALEARFDCDVERFCYPYGDYTPRVVDVVRESHDYATADDGHVAPATDPHRIPRVDASQRPTVVRWELTGAAESLRRRVGGAPQGEGYADTGTRIA
ncbi:polysaccharide deacetylase [Halarchaeum grantii]|uniref:Polysaccharide deacetylase n=1 Tax=Halarchaeum grantii TaxID=1193105 RepID=A0A830FBI0_9EURY|nr:polysaccharide deacetylase family protein [Halarchaeum grantii]GGL38238.1 polysaccharide deacetylase [Halarchaeum grantii]